MGSTIDGMQLRSCEIEIEGVLSARLVAFSANDSKRGCAAGLRTLGSGSRHTHLIRYKLCNEQKTLGAGCLDRISKLVAAWQF
jgi:hypothetical protein